MKQANVDNLTIQQLYGIFIETVMSLDNLELKQRPKFPIKEEEESYNCTGKSTIIYGCINEDEYITFLVSYDNAKYMTIKCVEKNEVIASFERDPATNGWKGIQPVVVNGESRMYKQSEQIELVTRLKRVL